VIRETLGEEFTEMTQPTPEPKMAQMPQFNSRNLAPESSINEIRPAVNGKYQKMTRTFLERSNTQLDVKLHNKLMKNPLSMSK